MNIQSFEDLKKAILYASHESGEEGWHDLEDMINIKREGDLLMFSYTNECNSKPPQEWTWLEKVSRGLVMNAKTGDIVARPFEKFWNLNFDLNPQWENIEGIYEKVDGSLGIIYYWEGKWRVCTRGSFNSKQAVWAQKHLDKKFIPYPGVMNSSKTILVEIIYPENIVVVDYHGLRGLILLDIIDNATGKSIIKNWKHLKEIVLSSEGLLFSDSYLFKSHEELLESLKDKEGSDFEGYVVKMKDGTRWKIKSEEYVRLHRIISNFRFKKILELVQTEDKEERIEEILDICPEYYEDIFMKYLNFIADKVQFIRNQVEELMEIAPRSDRKQFALWVQKDFKEYSSYLFAAYDNKDITPLIYKNAFNYTEEEIKELLNITGDTSFNNG